MSNFWEKIEIRRKSTDLSRAEMARRAGISESTITKGMSRGSKPISVVRQKVEKVLADAESSSEAAA